MGFSCSCDFDSGVVLEEEKPWTGHKTIKCRECGCELAPGHVVHTVVMAEWWDEPFEEMEEERLEEVLASDDTSYFHTCEKCADLGDAIVDTGICWTFGELWEGYKEWLDERGLPSCAGPGRWKG